jgi:predicted nucleic acid-binding Zn ribbon protein
MKTERSCLHCKGVINGRSDKKFCDDHCRNSYNNQRMRNKNNRMRNVNNILRRNRNILQKLTPGKTQKNTLKKESVLIHGFLFKYFTHLEEKNNGKIYFVYDYGYRFDGEENLIVMKEEAGMKD